jgi:4-hydroxybenzoate polyprenyltransferase
MKVLVGIIAGVVALSPAPDGTSVLLLIFAMPIAAIMDSIFK